MWKEYTGILVAGLPTRSEEEVPEPTRRVASRSKSTSERHDSGRGGESPPLAQSRPPRSPRVAPECSRIGRAAQHSLQSCRPAADSGIRGRRSVVQAEVAALLNTLLMLFLSTSRMAMSPTATRAMIRDT